MLGSLERQRATFAWKCGGLDAAGLAARLEPSALTLGGLLKHMARVEDDTFSRKLNGRAPRPPWHDGDWESDWRAADDHNPEELRALWEESVASSRAAVDEALAEGGLDRLGAPLPDGRAPSLRRLLIDLIEEYARHVGHADLIRESVDGLTGEDPPAE